MESAHRIKRPTKLGSTRGSALLVPTDYRNAVAKTQRRDSRPPTRTPGGSRDEGGDMSARAAWLGAQRPLHAQACPVLRAAAPTSTTLRAKRACRARYWSWSCMRGWKCPHSSSGRPFSGAQRQEAGARGLGHLHRGLCGPRRQGT